MRPRLVLAGVLAFILLLGTVACGSSEPGTVSTTAGTSTTVTQGGYTTLDVKTVHERLGVEKDARLVDVREPSEWATTGVPPGAILMPLGEVARRALAELAKDKPVYVICNSGNRSREAAEILTGLGFSQVYNVDGGIKAWLAAGLPVVPYQP